MQQLTPWLQSRFYYKDSIIPLEGGLIDFFFTGTTHKAPTFQSKEGSQNPNPVPLDIIGQSQIWLDESAIYDIYIRDKNGALQETRLKVSASSEGGGGGGLSFVTSADSDTITIEGLGTQANPLTANALISSITSNALGITTSGGGGMYVADLSSAIATLSINKLDKVNPAPQSVVSPVTFNDEVISKIGLTLGDNTWIKPESPQSALYLTNGTNPSTTNSTLHLTSNGSLLSGGDGTTQFGSFEQSTTQTDLQRTSGAINIQAGTVSGGSGIALDDQTGVSILATDVSTSNVFGALSLNPAGAQLNNGRGSVLDILPNQTLLSSVGTSGTLIEATNGLLELKGDSGIKLDDTVTLSSVASETPIKTLGRNSSNEIIEFDNVDVSTKLDKVDTAPQSVLSEVDFNGGVEVSGLLSNNSAITIPDSSWIRPQTANTSLFLTNGTNPSTQNSILELGNDYTILTAGGGVNEIGRVELSTNDIAIRHSVGGLGKDSLILRDQELSLQSSTGRGFYLTPTNLEMSNTTSNISLNPTGISLNGLNGGYEFINVPTDTPSFSYGENSSGELIKYVDGAIATPNLQDVTDEGSTTTNGATFGDTTYSTSSYSVDNYMDSFVSLPSSGTVTPNGGLRMGSIDSQRSMLLGGNKYSGSNLHRAGFTSAVGIEFNTNEIRFLCDEGLTIGSTYSPTRVLQLKPTEILANKTFKALDRILQGGVTDDNTTGIIAESIKSEGALNAQGDDFKVGTTGSGALLGTNYSDGATVQHRLYVSVGTSPSQLQGSWRAYHSTADATFPAHIRDYLGNDFANAKYILFGTDGGGTAVERFSVSNSGAEFVGTLTVGSILTGTPIGNVGYDATGKLVQGANVDVSLNRTLTLQAPTSADNITIFRTDVAITAQEVIAVSTGTSPSTTYILRHSTDRSAVGNLLTTSGTTTSTTSGDIATLSDSTIPADSWIWLETSAVSGSNVYLTIDIKYTED